MFNQAHAVGGVLGALADLRGTGHYVHWGFIQLSVANLVVIALMLVVFAAAIMVPFRRHRQESSKGTSASTTPAGPAPEPRPDGMADR